MSLHVKNIFIVVAALICIVLVPYIALSDMLTDSRIRMEQTATNFCIDLANNTLADEVGVMDAFVGDWSSWDDTYEYILDRNQAYLDSNIVGETFVVQQVDIMAYYLLSGEMIFGAQYDYEKEELTEISPGFAEYFRQHKSKLLPVTDDDKASGIILLPEGPMIIAIRPILTSNGEGPLRGAMIIGRYMNQRFLEPVSKRLGIPLNVSRLNDKQTPLEFQQAIDELIRGHKEKHLMLSPDGQASTGYSIIRDINGDAILAMQVRVPKSYFAFESDLSGFVMVFIVTGLVFGMGLIFMMEKFVLSRVGRLSKAASTIAQSRDMTARISLKGNDELGRLAAEINVMLEALEKSEQLLAAKEDAERAAIKLAEEKKFSENLIETINSFVIGLDLDGRITLFNRYAEKFSGYRREELVGKSSFTALVPAREHERVRKILKEASQNVAPSSIDLPIICKNGEEALIQWESSILFDENGEKIGTLSIGIDITERRKAETLINQAREQSEELSRELAVKVDELERFNRLAVGREQKIIELKKEVNQICEKHNEPKSYEVGFAE